MTSEELYSLIAKGETTRVEFKSWVKCRSKEEHRKLAVKSAVALANAQGGIFLFGVEDNGRITGCPNADPQSLMETVYDMTRPSLFTDVEAVQTEQGTVLVMTVEKSPVPVATSAGTYHKRLGKTSKPFYPNNIYSKADIQDLSAKIVDGATINDIDRLEVYKLKEKLRIRDQNSLLPDSEDIAFLKDMELIRVEGEEIYLTVAGLLFVGKEHSIRHHLPQAEIIYLHYSDTSQQEYDNRMDLQKPLIAVLDTLTEQIRMLNHLTNVQVGLFRMEVYDFTEKVFQEALLNAMTHRSYERMGAIYVKHYPNRIEIESPGGFPDEITVHNIITHPSVPRNKLIAMTLQRLRYVQRSGQGVDIMYKSMLLDGKPYPKYNVYPDSIRLTLHSTMENENFIRFVVEEQDRNQKSFELPKLMLLRYLTEHRRIMLAQSAALIQRDNEQASIELEELRNLGLVEPSGKEYMLTARAYEAMKTDVAYVQDSTLVQIKAKGLIREYLCLKESITNQKVRELCGYNKNQAAYILNEMVLSRELERIGSGRGTKYRLLNDD